MLRRNIRLVDIGRALGISSNFIRFWINNERQSQRVKDYFLNVLKVPLYLIDAQSQPPLPGLQTPSEVARLEREVIRRAWQEGMRDTQQIAERIGRNVRSVQRALKPIRDQERSKRDAAIRYLAKEGHTQQEIASKVGISRQAISKILMQLNRTFSGVCKADKEDQHV